MNGLAIASQLKQIDPSVPIMMLSALTTLPDEFVGLAETWVMKGVEPEVMLDKLDQLLQKRSEVGMKGVTRSLAIPSTPQRNHETQ